MFKKLSFLIVALLALGLILTACQPAAEAPTVGEETEEMVAEPEEEMVEEPAEVVTEPEEEMVEEVDQKNKRP